MSLNIIHLSDQISFHLWAWQCGKAHDQHMEASVLCCHGHESWPVDLCCMSSPLGHNLRSGQYRPIEVRKKIPKTISFHFYRTKLHQREKMFKKWLHFLKYEKKKQKIFQQFNRQFYKYILPQPALWGRLWSPCGPKWRWVWHRLSCLVSSESDQDADRRMEWTMWTEQDGKKYLVRFCVSPLWGIGISGEVAETKMMNRNKNKSET